MKMSRGVVVMHGNVAYFANWYGDIHSYNSLFKRWRSLSSCPNQHCSLVVINGQLTSIGGMDINLKCTNKLLNLKRNWKEVFPPMSMRRCSTTAVRTEDYLIVAGGSAGISHTTNSVEMMDIRNRI